MLAAQLPEQLRADCFCPTCQNHLVSTECADPWAICFSCKMGHRFFIMPEPPLSVDSGRAATLRFPELNDRAPEAIASFWFEEPAARSVLNSQLAQILRAVAEGRTAPHEPLFSFCPMCGGELSKFEQDDIWVEGLRCPASHSWYLRGGYISTPIAGTLIGLQAEYSDAVFSQSVTGWLKGGAELGRQLHESIRPVLAGYMPNRTDQPKVDLGTRGK
jgi:hypothetical protein